VLGAGDCDFARTAAHRAFPVEGFEEVPDCAERVAAVTAPRPVNVAVAVNNGLPKS
jgi:hypothetical protein